MVFAIDCASYPRAGRLCHRFSEAIGVLLDFFPGLDASSFFDKPDQSLALGDGAAFACLAGGACGLVSALVFQAFEAGRDFFDLRFQTAKVRAQLSRIHAMDAAKAR